MKYRTKKMFLLILFILSILGLYISFVYTEEAISAGIFLIVSITSFVLLIIRNPEEEKLTSINKVCLKKFSIRLKKFMNKIKDWIKKHWRALMIILIIGLWFYWFQWRPTEIRKECINKLTEIVKENKLSGVTASNVDSFFKICIRKKGLKE